MDILKEVLEDMEVETVSGRPVKIYSHDGGGTHPIHGAYYIGEVTDEQSSLLKSQVVQDYGWIICSWTPTGKRFEQWSTGLDLKPKLNETSISKK